MSCRAGSSRDESIVRFDPPFINFHSHNYTVDVPVAVSICVKDLKLPEIECGTALGARKEEIRPLSLSQQQESPQRIQQVVPSKTTFYSYLVTLLLVGAGMGWWWFESDSYRTQKRHQSKKHALISAKKRARKQNIQQKQPKRKNLQPNPSSFRSSPLRPISVQLLQDDDSDDDEQEIEGITESADNTVNISFASRTRRLSDTEVPENEEGWEQVGPKASKSCPENRPTVFVWKWSKKQESNKQSIIQEEGEIDAKKEVLVSESLLSAPPGFVPPCHPTTDPAVVSKCDAAIISSPQPVSKVFLSIDGMMCGGCATSVCNALEAVECVEGASVNLAAGTASVRYLNRLDLHLICNNLEAIGMSAYLCPEAGNLSTVNTGQPGPIAPPSKRQTPLHLFDELRSTQQSQRRYRCGCGCVECICSARPVHENDEGVEVDFEALCKRIEESLDLDISMDEKMRETGGSQELRESLGKLEFPCGCENKK